MTPKAKALNIYNRFFREVPFLQSKDSPIDDVDAAKKCALIAVDEILNVIEVPSTEYKYWKEVKQEIEKL
jgi:hypothetical protein